MAGVKISQLQDGGALQATDAFPVARGSLTRKILGAQLLDPLQSLDTRLNALSADVFTTTRNISAINVVDSPTIDLDWNASTRTLSANLISSGGSVPTGAIMTFPSIIAPTGWLALSGQTVSRTEYSDLWTFAQSSGNLVTNTNWTSLSAYGSFSDGDGSTTFRLPDLRGHFVRGFGTHTDGTAAGTLGVKQNDDFGSHTHTGSTAGAGGHNHTYNNTISNYTIRQGTGGDWPNVRGTLDSNGQTSSVGNHSHTLSIDSAGGTETRPKNIALLYCIKT